jgi:hypothetical protein
LVDRTIPPIIEAEDSRLRREYASGVENIYAFRDPENFFLAEWELVRGFFSGERCPPSYCGRSTGLYPSGVM